MSFCFIVSTLAASHKTIPFSGREAWDYTASHKTIPF